MSNYNLIQLGQVNNPQFSGYILDVVHPYTGILVTAPSGVSGQLQFKSGDFFGGSNLYYSGERFGFGTSTPSSDFHLLNKNLTIENGTGNFSTLLLNSVRVVAIDELNSSGVYLDGRITNISGFLTGQYYSTGTIDSGFYLRSNPSGFLTTGATGAFLTTKTVTGNSTVSGNLSVDFSGAYYTKYLVNGSLTVTGFQKITPGLSCEVKLSGYGANRSVTTDSGVKYAGTTPTGVSHNKILILKFTSYSNNVYDIVGEARMEP